LTPKLKCSKCASTGQKKIGLTLCYEGPRRQS